MKAYSEREGSEFQRYESQNLTVEFRRVSHKYWLHHDGLRIPVVSVTSALKVLDKPALLAWAEACGAEGAIMLERRGDLDGIEPRDVVGVVRDLRAGMDAKRDAGADRGTAVHDVLEFWGREKRTPSLTDFPAEVRGYVQGLCAWLVTARPVVSSVERFVGSIEHKYAGRLDMRAELDGRDCLIDLKSSPAGRIYPEAHAQAKAYAMAEVECGNPPPDGIVIVGVGADGSFVQVECAAEPRDWLAILDCHKAMVRVRAGAKLAAGRAGAIGKRAA